MSTYRRAVVPGGTFFFTVVTENRAPFLCHADARAYLRRAFRDCCRRWPFALEAVVLLPDHLHAIWTLPEHDSDFSTRWAFLKKRFTQLWLTRSGLEQPVSASRRRHRRRGVWQRRFWEHTIRDDEDLRRHTDYVHYNPVKHGLVACPHAYPYSSFHRCVRRGDYSADWACACNGRAAPPLRFDDIEKTTNE